MLITCNDVVERSNPSGRPRIVRLEHVEDCDPLRSGELGVVAGPLICDGDSWFVELIDVDELVDDSEALRAVCKPQVDLNENVFTTHCNTHLLNKDLQESFLRLLS